MKKLVLGAALAATLAAAPARADITVCTWGTITGPGFRFEVEETRKVGGIVVHEGRVIVRGDVLDDTIAARFGVDVTVPDVDTVGGLVWHALGRLPEVGDQAVLEPAGLVVRVDEMEGREVRWVSFDVPEASA